MWVDFDSVYGTVHDKLHILKVIYTIIRISSEYFGKLTSYIKLHHALFLSLIFSSLISFLSTNIQRPLHLGVQNLNISAAVSRRFKIPVVDLFISTHFNILPHRIRMQSAHACTFFLLSMQHANLGKPHVP